MAGKFGLHRPQSNYAPVSSRLTPATFVGLAVHYQRISRLQSSKMDLPNGSAQGAAR
jgi:hypothetical protein